jgi:hypothetical protein
VTITTNRGGRRQGHSRWPHCDGAGDCRTRTLSGYRYLEIIFPHDARAADPAYLDAINRARQVMATYSDLEESPPIVPVRSRRWMKPLHSTSHWEPSWRKVRKKQRLGRGLPSWTASFGVEETQN